MQIQVTDPAVIGLVIASLALVSAIALVTRTAFNAPWGPFTPAPTNLIPARQYDEVFGSRAVIPQALTHGRFRVRFYIAWVDPYGRPRRKALKRRAVPVKFTARARGGEELLQIPQRTFEHYESELAHVLSDKMNYSDQDSIGVVFRIHTPINPVAVLFTHPDAGVRTAGWLTLITTWFGIAQSILLR